MEAEKKLFDFDWQLNKTADPVRGRIYEEQLSGQFLSSSRVGLAADTILRHVMSNDRLQLDIPLRCLVEPHSESQFDWFQLTVDFTANEDVAIKGLVPQNVKGDIPVKLTVKHTVGMGFEVGSIKLGPTASREVSEEKTVYSSKIDGTGIDTATALWKFSSSHDEELVFDGALRILLEVPASLKTLRVKFAAEGSVRSKGLIGKIPLLAQREFNFEVFSDFE